MGVDALGATRLSCLWCIPAICMGCLRIGALQNVAEASIVVLSPCSWLSHVRLQHVLKVVQ